jgi:hypothetical protein
VPDVVEPLEVPAAPLLVCGLVVEVDEGDTAPVAEPAAAPMPDAEPDADPVPAQAVRAATQARGKSILIIFSSLTEVFKSGKNDVP